MQTVSTSPSVTLSTSISAPYDTAFAYLANPRALPEWSVNFIQSIRKAGDQLLATTPFGEMPVTMPRTSGASGGHEDD